MKQDDASPNKNIEIIVEELSPKERIDAYLSKSEELNLSRNQIQKLIDSRDILLNGNQIKSNYKLSGGEAIQVSIPPTPTSELIAENIPLEIIFEDEYMLVVNKPVGMVTHPATGNHSGTLVNAIIYYMKTLSDIDPERPGIVHRLDKNTSGLVMIAKNNEVHRKLQAMLKERAIEKNYHAVICGHLKEEQGIINLPIGRSLKNRKKMIVTNIKSRESITEYALLDRFKLYDYVKVGLKTGRTHQIRVHFTHLGHPVLGDPDYGGRDKWHRGIISYDKLLAKKTLDLMKHQALHAKELKFVHPITEQNIELDAPLPEDYRNLLDFLDKDGR